MYKLPSFREVIVLAIPGMVPAFVGVMTVIWLVCWLSYKFLE